MNETPPPLPPAAPDDPRPFDPSLRPVVPGKASSGCQRPLLIGCGVVTLLLGVAAVVLVLKAKDVLAYAMGQLRTQIHTRLPLDLTDEERRHLDAAFDETIARIRAGHIDPLVLQELQKSLVDAAQSTDQRRMSRPQLEKLMRDLDAFNGVPADPKPEAPPVPGPPDGEPGTSDGSKTPPGR